ncbi:hypothetical protein GGR55DRAFT_624941 [Xylaria sp. FL0064]|nr:hypothetical protein GGR55DRAFT_624941 [Xylaria sp. FL0064]
MGLQSDGPSLADVDLYEAETEVLLKEFFQASLVVCYDFLIRENIIRDRIEIDIEDLLHREETIIGAHIDVRGQSGPGRIRDQLNAASYEKFSKLSCRFRIVTGL